MKKPTISVVVPAFNEEKYLPRCLLSLKKQTYPPLEIIVVDNNSSDKTAQIAKKFAAKVVFEKKQGMAYARDAGFKMAKGEIIARTDADSEVPPNWLMRIVGIFKKNRRAIALTGTATFSDSHPLINFISRYIFTATLYLFRLFAGHHQLNGPTFAVKRKALKTISPCSDNPFCHEDMDLACHLAAKGEIIFDPSLVVLSSARRLRKAPLDLFLKYIFMGIYTFLIHRHPFVRSHHLPPTPGVDSY